MSDDNEIDLREAIDRLRAEIKRQHPDTDIHGPLALVRANRAFNVTDLAKAVLGMRICRWDEPK